MTAPERLPPAAVELLEDWPLFDNSVLAHGFTPYSRDYELRVLAFAAVPDGSRSYAEGEYRYLFTHCVVAQVETAVPDHAWVESWDDLFTDRAAHARAGHPEGWVWDGAQMEAYPGGSYVPDSPRAAEWAARLGRPMHEVRIETNNQNLALVFHALRVHRVAAGDPTTDALTRIEPVDLITPAT